MQCPKEQTSKTFSKLLVHVFFVQRKLFKLSMSCAVDGLSELLEFTSREYVYVIYDMNYWVSETKIKKKYYKAIAFLTDNCPL